MQAGDVRAVAAKFLSDAGLHKEGRSLWSLETKELIWTVELDRSGSRPWAVMFGALVRAWAPETAPRPHTSHVYQDYALHNGGVPDRAVEGRFSDHLSYFTAVMDHGHALISDEERREALAFMADELSSTSEASRPSTTSSELWEGKKLTASWTGACAG